MIYADLFKEYESLMAKADYSYQKIKNEHSSCVKCRIHCDDCCYAVFGLFLIEAVYLKHHFDELDREYQREALLRGEKAEEDLLKIERKLQMLEVSPRAKNGIIGKERVRCPLLNDNRECMLHPFRPITCRVYGIPTIINGKARVCWKAEFDKGKTYPAFNLDATHKELYQLSRRLLEKAGQTDMEKASFLLSVPKAIKTPVEDLMTKNLE